MRFDYRQILNANKIVWRRLDAHIEQDYSYQTWMRGTWDASSQYLSILNEHSTPYTLDDVKEVGYKER